MLRSTNAASSILQMGTLMDNVIPSGKDALVDREVPPRTEASVSMVPPGTRTLLDSVVPSGTGALVAGATPHC